MHAECFIYGNVNKEKSLQISSLVENKLKLTNAFVLPQLSRQLLLKREYKLNEGNLRVGSNFKKIKINR
jgi:insulysin